MKNCVRLPFAYGLIIMISCFLGAGNASNIIRYIIDSIFVGLFFGFIFTLMSWPLFYFLPAMPDFKKVKQLMQSHHNVIHSDCACIHAVYKPTPNALNLDPQIRESYFTGYFFMTETAIVFKSDGSSSKYLNDTVIYYTSIQSVKKCFIHPIRMNDSISRMILFTAGITVNMKNGDSLNFILGERKKILSEMDKKILQGMETVKNHTPANNQSAVQMDDFDERICPYCGSKTTSTHTECKNCGKSFIHHHK